MQVISSKENELIKHIKKLKDKKESNEQNIDYNQEIIVALDGIQDPWNLGTILRTVDSVGLT